MTDIPVAELLANFIVASIVFWFSNQTITYLKGEIAAKNTEIERLRQAEDAATQRHMADLRDWSGLNPRFTTWNQPVMGDTKRFSVPPDVDPQEYARQHQGAD